MKKNLSGFLLFFIHFFGSAQTQNLTRTSSGFPVNYSEDSVGTYVLPDPLIMRNGKKVTDAKTWTQKQRPELVKLFEEIEYGKMPTSCRHAF